MTNPSNGSSECIRIIQFAPDEWRVWVPPTRDEDYEVPGDPDSALLGPAGDSFWPSFDAAVTFVRDVLASRATPPAVSLADLIARGAVPASPVDCGVCQCGHFASHHWTATGSDESYGCEKCPCTGYDPA